MIAPNRKPSQKARFVYVQILEAGKKINTNELPGLVGMTAEELQPLLKELVDEGLITIGGW